MANEPQWEPIEAPAWATKPAVPAEPKAEPKSEPKWEPIEAPSWAKGGKQAEPLTLGRVAGRAGEAMAETAGGAWEAAKNLVVPPSKEEAQKHLGPSGMWRSFKETGAGLLSPITGTVGTAISGAASPIASGVSEAARIVTGGDPKRSEEMYERARPMAEAALGAVGRTPGIATTSKYPMPDFKVPTHTKTPAKGPEAEAGRYLESEASDPAALRQGLNQPIEELAGAGDKPTTFQQTGQLGQLEKATARRPGQVQPHLDRKAAQNAARQQTLEQLQPTGDPMAVANELRAAMQAETQAADAAAAQAAQRAQQAIEAEGGRVDPTTYGNIFRRELEIAEDAARARERALWERVDPDRTLQSNPQPIQELERRVYGNMTEAGAASITPAETQIAGLIQGYRPVIPFQELRDLRSLTSGALRNELYSNGRTPAYARLSQLRQGIEEAIPRSFSGEGEAATGVADRLRAASAATRQRAETFRPTRGITRKEGVEGPYKLEDVSTIPEKIIASGTKGYDRVSQYLRAVGNERGLPELTDAFVARMRREVIGMDGEVNPRKLEGFLRRYQDTLRAIDAADGGAFSARMRNIQTAQETIETTTANQAAVAARYRDDQFRALTGATNEADATNMIGGIFGRQDSVQRAQELMRRLTTAEAQEGARAAVVRHIRERLTSNAQLGEDLLLRAEQFQTWVNKNNAALRQILRPEQLKSLEDIALSLRRANRSNQTKATGGGSDTYQNFLAGQVQQGPIRALAQKYGPAVARIMAHWMGTAAFGPGAGSVAAEIGVAGVHTVKASRVAKAAQRMERVQSLIDDAILNPEKARELLRKTHTYKSKTPGTRSGAAYYAGALGAEAERDDKQKRVPRQAGGGVPAIGGTGGRSPGARAAARPGAARQGTSQALPDGRTTLTLSYDDGGEVKPAPVETRSPGFRERHAAALAGTPASGPAFEKLQTRKGLTAPTREDIRKTLQTFGISGEAAGGFGERQLGERADVDSRALGGGVDDPTGERSPIHYDPADDTTFGARFGEWDQTATGKSLPRDEEDVDSTIMAPGQKLIDPLGHRGERGKAGYYYTRGMAEGGSVNADSRSADRWADLPSSQNVEDRRGEDELSIGQLIAASQAFMGHYPSPYTRSRRPSAAAGPVSPDTLIDQTQKYVADQLAGVEDHHEKQDPLEAAIEDLGGFRARQGEGGSDEGRLPLRRAEGGGIDWEEDKLPLPGQSRGLRSTAGPTVTSTTAEEDIPAPITNRAGETIPTWLLKHWGQGLASKAQHLADLPQRSFEQAGELQGTGYSELDAPAEAAKHIVLGPAGMLARPGAGGAVLGAGAVRRAAPAEIARAAEASPGMTQPQLRTLYGELGLTGLPPTELAAKSLARTQPPKVIEEATALKMADRERLNELTPDERLLFQKGKLNKPGFMLPSQEAAEPGLAAFKPVKKEITRAEKEFDRMPQQPGFFDISARTLNRTPDVEQFPLPRVAPKMTERLEPAFQSGSGLRRIERAAEASQPSGWGWYNIQEALKSFTDILGPVRGPQAASAWLDSLAGTSMVNPISSNVRGSSYYLGNVMRGEPLPQVLTLKDPSTGKTIKTLAGPPPPGYGAKSQVQHADRVREYLQNAGDPVTNPKPMSYRQNLGGNYRPRTIDTHDIRNMVGMPQALRTFGEEGALLPGEYAMLEQLGARAAQRAGTPQAPQQAATWVGGGGYTGLKSEPIPLAEVLNRRIWVTSKVTGRTPEQVWTDHVTGRAPLMADGGVVAGLGR